MISLSFDKNMTAGALSERLEARGRSDQLLWPAESTSIVHLARGEDLLDHQVVSQMKTKIVYDRTLEWVAAFTATAVALAVFAVVRNRLRRHGTNH